MKKTIEQDIESLILMLEAIDCTARNQETNTPFERGLNRGLLLAHNKIKPILQTLIINYYKTEKDESK